MRRRFLRKLKEVIICTITVIMWLISFASSVALIEANYIAFFTLLISCAWIWLFIKANQEEIE